MNASPCNAGLSAFFHAQLRAVRKLPATILRGSFSASRDRLFLPRGFEQALQRVATLFAVVTCANVLLPCTVFAQSTWNNTGTEWTSGTSWSSGSAPANSATATNTNTAVFANLAAGFNNVNLSTDRSIYGVLFTAGANAYTFTGGALTINGAYGISNYSTNVQTFSNKVINSSSSTTYGSYAAGGSLVFVGGIDLTTGGSSTSRTLTLGGSGDITVSGVIANGGSASAGNITVTNTGLTILSGNNTYGGTTTINTNATLTLSGSNSYAGGTALNGGGTLNINNANAIGTGALTIGTSAFLNNTSGGAITNLGNNNITLGDGLTFGTAGSTSTNNLNLGTGTVAAASSRTITIAGTGVTLAMGTLDSTSSSSTGRTFTANGAGNTLALAGWKIQSGSTNNVTASLAGTANWTISGAIVNGSVYSNGVQIDATGLTTFGGNNTYDGATAVSSGATLRLGSATALGSTANGTTVNTGGGLDLNGQAIAGEALNISGTGVSSSGAVFNSSASAASWSGNIVQTTAAATIKATNGSITLSGGIELGNVVTARTLTLDGAGRLILSGNISNSFAGSAGALVIAATASNVTLSGSNSYSGTTTLGDGGALNINSANAISTNTFSIGTSAFLNNTSGGAITNLGNNNITLSEGLTFGTAGSTSTNNLNLGTGTVAAASSRTITIAGTGVTLAMGTLDSTSSSSTGRTFTANGAGNTLALAGWKIQSGSLSNIVAKLAGTANWTISGAIVNGSVYSNGVQIDATGLTTFGGNNTYDGTTIVSTNATLRITSATALGSTNTGTTVNAGGQLQLSGGITVDAGEALTLTGPSGSVASLRNISGNNTFNGGITLSGTNRIDSDAGTLTLSSFANGLASTRLLYVGGAGNTVFTGRLTGTGSIPLTKDGSGTLTFANTNNDLSGGVLVNAGTVALATNDALGATRAVAINGGALNITTFNNTVGAVTLTNGSITGTTGVLTGSSYAVENGSISAILGGSGALTKSTTGTVTLSGVNTYSGGTTVSAGSLVLGANNVLADSGAVTVSGGTLSIASYSDTVGAVKMTSGSITGSGGALTGSSYAVEDGTISAILGGSGALTKSNTGTVTLSGNNTYSGTTTINAGALKITSATALGSTVAGTTVNAGGQLQLSGGITVDAGETLALGGTDSSVASLRNISGNNAYNGPITFTANTTNRIDSDAGTLTLSSFTNGLASSRVLYVGGAGNTVFTGRITGSGSPLTKDGFGTLTFANTNNDLSGGVLVNAGTVALATNDALGATRAVAINGGALNITTFNNTVGAVTLTNGSITGTTGVLTGSSYAVENGSISAILGGSGALAKSTAGTVTLSGSNNYSGNTTIGAGTLRLGQVNALSTGGVLLGSSSTANNSTLELAAGGNYTLNSFGTSASAGANLVFTNSSGSAATLTFTNATNYVTLGSANSAARTIANSSTNLTLTFNGAVDIGSSTSTNVTFNATGNIAINGEIFNTNTAGVRGLTKTGTGTLTLAGNNTYNGTTTISAGTLQVGNGGTTGSLGTNIVTNNALLVFNRSGSYTAGNNISGSGSLTKSGNGTLTLSGANTYSGATTVSAGTLELAKVGGSALGSTASVSVATNAVLLLSQSDQVNSAASVSMSGGTIRRAGGVSEVFGDLSLTTGSFLDFSTGAAGTMSFGTYTPSSLLTVQNFFPGNTLTFRSNLTGTINNGSLFSFDGGFTSSWNDGASTFTITAIPEPSTFVAAFGLISLMLWPSRRRLIKDVKAILGLRAPIRDRLSGRA